MHETDNKTTMSSQHQLEQYFSHLNITKVNHQSELRLVADDAAIPTHAQMKRALRSSRRKGDNNLSLDRWTYHTPCPLKDCGNNKGTMRWNASSSSSSSSSISTMARSKSRMRSTASSDALMVLPQRRWKDAPPTSREKSTRNERESFLSRSNSATTRHNSFEGMNSTWDPCCTESDPLKNTSKKAFQQEYMSSVLASLSQAECLTRREENSTTVMHIQIPLDSPTALISRALDISTSATRSTDLTSVPRRL